MQTDGKPLGEVIGSVQQRLVEELLALDRHVFSTCPLDRYISALDAYPPAVRLGYVGSAVRRCCDLLRASIGDSGLELYHRCLLLALIERALTVLPARRLPGDIPALYEASFRRLIGRVEKGGLSQGAFLHPSFSKELGLCTLRFIPAGPALLHQYRLPRQLFLTSSPQRWLAWAAFVVKMGGLGPCYEFHLPSNDARALAAEFTPEGWKRFYQRLAALLGCHPRMKGVFAGSWFFDPALAAISPELAYLRTRATEHGGRVFYAGPCTADGIGGATLLSPKRKLLYEEGKYVPRGYVLVWPRRELLAGAQRT